MPNSLALGMSASGEWRVEKDKMEKPTGGTWTEFDWSPRPLLPREYALREFWGIFSG